MKALAMLIITVFPAFGADRVLMPQLDGEWWQVAGDPDLGKYSNPKQQPVDFAIWQQRTARGKSGPAFAAPTAEARPGCSIAGKAPQSLTASGSPWASRWKPIPRSAKQPAGCKPLMF